MTPPTATAAATDAPPRNPQPRSLTDRLLAAWGVLVLAFLFAPIVVVVIYSFNEGRLLIAWDHFGFGSYTGLLDRPEIRHSVIVSLQVAVLSALVATLLGTTAGVALARRPGRWVVLFLGLLLLISVTPEIVDAVSLLPWMVYLGQDAGLVIFNNGLVRLVVGHSLFSTAVVAYLVRARLVGLDESLEEASADLYAVPWRTFRQITVPLAMPAVLAGFLLSFTLSLDNTIVSAFVQVSGSTPWPVYVLSSLRSGLRPEIAAMSTIMLLVTLLALALMTIVLRRAGDSATDIARNIGG
ncbi:MAG: ABC transporter permease [Nocardioides sp.]|uniref:ABC transporter permease n=1 Tax=Nocardioides sp. TaxID=35761 RepID=UPI0039E6D64C